MEIIRITDDDRQLVEPGWLASAEHVHRQLRPQLTTDYRGKMLAIFAAGGEMCVGVEDDRVLGLAVFRSFANTHVGHKFYVDDLVTDEAVRSSGVGHGILTYLEGLARARHCPSIELDSALERTLAHRFYFREGYVISAFVFRKQLP